MTEPQSAAHHYRQILDTAPDAMVIVGPAGNIVYVNLQTEKLFGYSRAELVGRELDSLIPERFRGSHSGHLKRYFQNPGVRPMGSGLELFGRLADGREVPIEVSLSPVHTPDGILVSAAIRDITERKRIESAAKLNADRLSSAVESIQDALALYDASDRLVLCNSVFRRALGGVAGRVIGQSFEQILRAWSAELSFPSEQERVDFVTERLAARRDPKGAYDVRTRDGRSLRVTDRRTLEGGIVQTVWDLSEDVQRELELRDARATAEAASSAKSEFLASMSHELRTPLNAILGFAQLLERDRKQPLSERQQERARQILKGGEHLLRLIDDILDLSRIEAGAVSISSEPVDVADVLGEVHRVLEAMAAAEGIRCESDALPPELPKVSADRTRFSQILMNFGSNAIKYNRPGGSVKFTVSVLEPESVRVTVTDTGLGIPEDKHDRLFQPFQRAGQETGPIEGTGIGLVISKRLAELMGGTVGFKSVVGQGSSFWVELPAYRRLQPTAIEAPVSMSTRPIFDAEHRRLVLYVEDNPANVAFIQDLVGGFEGIELITAPTAEMGVELARRRQPVAIIMDINLPGMSGLDALRELRAMPETKHIPVIALTAAASERDRLRGEQAGFYRYLTKPVKVDELESALEALFARKT